MRPWPVVWEGVAGEVSGATAAGPAAPHPDMLPTIELADSCETSNFVKVRFHLYYPHCSALIQYSLLLYVSLALSIPSHFNVTSFSDTDSVGRTTAWWHSKVGALQCTGHWAHVTLASAAWGQARIESRGQRGTSHFYITTPDTRHWAYLLTTRWCYGELSSDGRLGSLKRIQSK